MLKCEVMQLHSNANIAVPLSVAWAFEVPSDTSFGAALDSSYRDFPPWHINQLEVIPL